MTPVAARIRAESPARVDLIARPRPCRVKAAAPLLAALLLVLRSAFTPSVTRAEAPESDPHAAQPERPTVATHAHTVAPGWIEIECGLERDHQVDGSTGLAAPFEMKIGLSRRAQLSLNTPWEHQESGPGTGSGPGDLSLGIKWRPIDRAPLLGDFALLPALTLPTGSASRGTGTGTTDVSLLLISSHDLGPIALDVNAGYTRRGGNGGVAPTEATLWTVSSGFPVIGPVGGAAEIYGLPGTSGPQGGRPIVAVLAGPTLTPRRWLEVDAGVIVPVAGPQPRAFYGGFVWNLGRL
jgi:hypothetical protein